MNTKATLGLMLGLLVAGGRVCAEPGHGFPGPQLSAAAEPIPVIRQLPVPAYGAHARPEQRAQARADAFEAWRAAGVRQQNRTFVLNVINQTATQGFTPAERDELTMLACRREDHLRRIAARDSNLPFADRWGYRAPLVEQDLSGQILSGNIHRFSGADLYHDFTQAFPSSTYQRQLSQDRQRLSTLFTPAQLAVVSGIFQTISGLSNRLYSVMREERELQSAGIGVNPAQIALAVMLEQRKKALEDQLAGAMFQFRATLTDFGMDPEMLRPEFDERTRSTFLLWGPSKRAEFRASGPHNVCRLDLGAHPDGQPQLQITAVHFKDEREVNFDYAQATPRWRLLCALAVLEPELTLDQLDPNWTRVPLTVQAHWHVNEGFIFKAYSSIVRPDPVAQPREAVRDWMAQTLTGEWPTNRIDYRGPIEASGIFKTLWSRAGEQLGAVN